MSPTTPEYRSVILLVSQQTRKHVKVTITVCHFLSVPEKRLEAVIPDKQVIAWKLALVFAFAIPECGAFIRAVRLWFFKSVRSPTWAEFGMVFIAETLHVSGLVLLAFKILPELDVIQGAMLTNCLCFIPSILCKSMPPLDLSSVIYELQTCQACCPGRRMNPNERSSMFWTSAR